MITTSDSFDTYDMGTYYSILANNPLLKNEYQKKGNAIKKFPIGLSYNSETNPNFLSIDDIRELIINHIKPDFHPI